MDEYVFAMGRCWSCGNLFSFDPDHVPSIPIDPLTNLPSDLGGEKSRVVRQPICRSCVDRANQNRVESGRPKIVIHHDAYPGHEG